MTEVRHSAALSIRAEKRADLPAISNVIVEAFAVLPISSHTEHFIVDALRAAEALTISLVAEIEGELVGHIAFSPVTVADATIGWFGLGPVAVLPLHQRKGIGKALIQAGLAQLRELGAQGCCLVGHPTYYRKFGFTNVASLVYQGARPDVFFALSFSGRYPSGNVSYHPAFRATTPPSKVESATTRRAP